VRVVDDAQACGGNTRTRLEVSEGVVEVRAAGISVRVAAGARWPVDCPSTAASSPSAGERAEATGALAESRSAPHFPPPVTERKHSGANSSRSSGSPSTVSSSSATPDAATLLSQQNDAFAKSVALRRQGDVPAALRSYQDLISRFPNSPLAENAMVERMRLMAGSGGADAHTEARRYLTRYPNGFAASEARRILGSP
jgi:TolA-binding protein